MHETEVRTKIWTADIVDWWRNPRTEWRHTVHWVRVDVVRMTAPNGRAAYKKVLWDIRECVRARGATQSSGGRLHRLVARSPDRVAGHGSLALRGCGAHYSPKRNSPFQRRVGERDLGSGWHCTHQNQKKRCKSHKVKTMIGSRPLNTLSPKPEPPYTTITNPHHHLEVAQPGPTTFSKKRCMWLSD